MRPRGEVIGSAGFGLKQDDVSWAANREVASIGARGEEATAKILNQIASRPGGPTVLHDVAIPIPGFTANIDHIIVSGRKVIIIDTKVWRPAFYWTLFGKTRRGMERFAPAEKKTMAMAADHIGSYLAKKGTPARILLPQVWVWPSSQRSKMSVWAMQIPHAKTINGQVASARALKSKYQTADPSIVVALVPLVASIDA